MSPRLVEMVEGKYHLPHKGKFKKCFGTLFQKEPKKEFLMKNNIELTTNLLRLHYADSSELDNKGPAKFIQSIKEFDFKEGDYISLLEMSYGPNIHVEIIAGYDMFTYNEDGTVCNNPETDTKRFYVEVMVLGDNNGPSDECIETIWLDEEYPDGMTLEDACDIWDRAYETAKDFIKEEVNKLPGVWVVQLETSEENRDDEYFTLFSSYEKAKEFFDEKVADEQTPGNSFVGDIWENYENGSLEESDYEVVNTEDSFSVTETCYGTFVSWTLYKKEIF